MNYGGQILVKEVARNGDGLSLAEPKVDGKNEYESVIAVNDSSSTSTSKNNVRYEIIDINDPLAYNFINYYNCYENDTRINSYNGVLYYPSSSKKNSKTGEVTKLRYQTGDEIIKSTLDIEEMKNDEETSVANLLQGSEGEFTGVTVKYNGIEITDRAAKEYYIRAYFFSSWVTNNLGNVTAGSVITKTEGTNQDAYIDFTGDGSQIFRFTSDNNPESDESLFVNHKRNVIKNSIQYNLNSSISTYNMNHGIAIDAASATYAYRLPVLSNSDWDSILNNVTMVSFMQGIPCGTTTFNNYAVVKSNNNNTSVSLENLYFTEEMGINKQSNHYYHKYDCEKIGENVIGAGKPIYDSDLSAEFKYDAKKINSKIDDTTGDIICFYDDSTNTYYDAIYNPVFGGYKVGENPVSSVPSTWIDATTGSEVRYLYDHENLGCYDCIISGNYTPVVKFYDGDLRRTGVADNGELVLEIIPNSGAVQWVYENGITYIGTVTEPTRITDVELEKEKSIYTALAKKKIGLYKTNNYVNR